MVEQAKCPTTTRSLRGSGESYALVGRFSGGGHVHVRVVAFKCRRKLDRAALGHKMLNEDACRNKFLRADPLDQLGANLLANIQNL